MPRQFISADEAIPCDHQPTKPCADCPFARTAIAGWLGNMTVDEWIKAVHGEAMIDCHTLIGPQCAGAAIYRGNVCKLPHDKDNLKLPADRKIVFASPMEFRSHHGSERK